MTCKFCGKKVAEFNCESCGKLICTDCAKIELHSYGCQSVYHVAYCLDCESSFLVRLFKRLFIKK
ncbi:hypothetical protein SYNTR_0797 [Candidatus Syntrophocurvum alkaliphilum]|uniref:B box-type domain-containing protein n=1 Tax=Candidatus Syntrophocurvum alkaliphilum TaxID=2293317 RepID=A0A6I6DG51_9FIRM|nr:B-box zinc finger protein [Candidatus Syntrophocurvum alkaliphilum]QGT99390.1 hypothetical protein SYNTR_0797 [Candidatus Syntrophocurvum alkaliphilum]